MASLHLLEPYRSGLLAKAMDEGLVRAYPRGAEEYSDAIRIGRSVHIQEATLQLLALFDDITVVWSEPSSETIKRKAPCMTALGLKNSGAVRFVQGLSGPLKEGVGWEAETIEDIWKIEEKNISDFQPMILSQLEARGKKVHYALLRLLRAHRLGESTAIPVIFSAIPSGLGQEAKAILSNHPRVFWDYDFPVLTTLHEIRFSLKLVDESGSKVAGAPISSEKRAISVPEAVSDLMAIIVDELLKQGIEFPLPQSFTEVVKFRNRPEIRDFRSTFFPWLDSICKGEVSAEKKLRKKVRSSAKAFKRFPVVKKLARLIGYASLGLGVVEALLLDKVEPTIATGVVAVGCDRIAERWRKRSSWVYLSLGGS